MRSWRDGAGEVLGWVRDLTLSWAWREWLGKVGKLDFGGLVDWRMDWLLGDWLVTEKWVVNSVGLFLFLFLFLLFPTLVFTFISSNKQGHLHWSVCSAFWAWHCGADPHFQNTPFSQPFHSRAMVPAIQQKKSKKAKSHYIDPTWISLAT